MQKPTLFKPDVYHDRVNSSDSLTKIDDKKPYGEKLQDFYHSPVGSEELETNNVEDIEESVKNLTPSKIQNSNILF